MTGRWHAIKLGPDKNPAKGEVIATSRSREEILHHWVAGEVAIGWTPEHKPMRRMSQQGLAAVRMQRLQRRLKSKTPLLADLLEEEERAARPAFYSGAER